MEKSEEFNILEVGTTYQLPLWRVVDGKGIQLVYDVETSTSAEYEQEITFVRGSKEVVSREEFENAVKIINECAIYLGKDHFDLKTEKWKPTSIVYETTSPDFYLKKYNKAEEVVNLYGKVIPSKDGILHEQLLGMMITDLKYKNSLVPSRESSIAITKLEEALMWLNERQRERKNRNVNGTYNK